MEKTLLILSNGGEGVWHVIGSCLGLWGMHQAQIKNWKIMVPLAGDLVFGVTSIITAIYLHLH